jgi:hypothetical protein
MIFMLPAMELVAMDIMDATDGTAWRILADRLWRASTHRGRLRQRV